MTGMDKPENKPPNQASLGIGRRLIVIVPCILAAVLLAVDWGTSELWNSRTEVKFCVSVLSGPISTWIEFSGRTTRRDKTFALVVSPAILLGILAHPIKPRFVTGVVTVLSTLFWCFWGLAITCMGV